MQLLLVLDETDPVVGAVPLWETLDAPRRAEVVTLLARLIARAAEDQILATPGAEPCDE